MIDIKILRKSAMEIEMQKGRCHCVNCAKCFNADPVNGQCKNVDEPEDLPSKIILEAARAFLRDNPNNTVIEFKNPVDIK